MRERDEVQSQSPSRSCKLRFYNCYLFLTVLLRFLTQIIIKSSWNCYLLSE